MPSCQRERGANTEADTDPGEETGGTMDQEADDVPGDGPGDRVRKEMKGAASMALPQKKTGSGAERPTAAAENPLSEGGVHEETQHGSPNPQQRAECPLGNVAPTEAEPESRASRFGPKLCPPEAAKGPRPQPRAPRSPPGPAAKVTTHEKMQTVKASKERLH